MEKEIRITVKSPVDCTEEEFRAWIYFCLGYRADIQMSNPLHEYDLEATDVTIY